MLTSAYVLRTSDKDRFDLCSYEALHRTILFMLRRVLSHPPNSPSVLDPQVADETTASRCTPEFFVRAMSRPGSSARLKPMITLLKPACHQNSWHSERIGDHALVAVFLGVWEDLSTSVVHTDDSSSRNHASDSVHRLHRSRRQILCPSVRAVWLFSEVCPPSSESDSPSRLTSLPCRSSVDSAWRL